MRNTLLRDALWYIGFALYAIFAVRLLQLRLAKRYLIVLAFLCFNVVRNAALLYLHPGGEWTNPRLYSWVYGATQPLVPVFYFLIVFELYSLMVEDFPGIRRLARLVMFSAVGVVAVLGGVVILLDRQAGYDRYPLISYLVLEQRSAYLGLGGLTLFLLLFAAHYSLQVSRNVWILWSSFGGLFLIGALVYTFRRHVGQGFEPVRDLVMPVAIAFALLGPILFLSKAGEVVKRPISALGAVRRPELEMALSAQLQNFNQVLVKVLRQ